jgi:hypothetical protein
MIDSTQAWLEHFEESINASYLSVLWQGFPVNSSCDVQI